MYIRIITKKSMNQGCHYVDLFGEAFGWTQMVPTLITLFLSGFSFVTSEFIFLFYGLFLHFSQLILWTIQYYFKQMRPNPVCQQYHSYAYPSIEVFYAISLITAVVVYSYHWKIVHSWFVWLMMYIFFIGVPFILVFMHYNTPGEVFISALIAIIMTGIFMTVVHVYMRETLPYILTEFPCAWLGYKDTYIMDKECREEYIKCKNLKL